MEKKRGGGGGLCAYRFITVIYPLCSGKVYHLVFKCGIYAIAEHIILWQNNCRVLITCQPIYVCVLDIMAARSRCILCGKKSVEIDLQQSSNSNKNI